MIKDSLIAVILQILKDQGPMHGYALNNQIESLINRKVITSSLYRSLHKLRKEKYLVTATSLEKNRMRIYYALTPKGIALAKQKTDQLNKFFQSVRSVINPGKSQISPQPAL
jgi:DNA-binding PadR family transcriptional regulator